MNAARLRGRPLSARLDAVRGIALRGLAAYGLAALLVLYTPLAELMVAPLRIPSVEMPAEAIVVLTAWASPTGVLNEPALRRVHKAARLFRQGLAPVLIISGGGDPESEGHRTAEFMARFAEELGVPAAAVILEQNSRNTFESAVNVSARCRALRIHTVFLVTDAIHMRRASGAFAHQGVTVLPASADPWNQMWETPGIRMEKFWAAVHEYAGLLYYRWKGWL